MNSVRCFVGATRVDAVPAHDRGFAYGDGVFETLRAHRGTLPWWDAHWDRLGLGAARLGLELPDRAQVLEQACELLAGDDGVLKLVVSRGPGGRGYAPPPVATPTWVLSREALPAPPPPAGLTLRWCDTRLGLQPALAGIKHCNRLEQVLARAEWQQLPAPAAAHEGLMRSSDGDVVCATAANVFMLRDGRWRTPRVDRCGVAGICRQWAMAALDAGQSRIAVGDIETADAVFLCNAVRGILPVARLAARDWPRHTQVTDLQQRLAGAHPGFATAPTTEMP